MGTNKRKKVYGPTGSSFLQMDCWSMMRQR
jgi:hypothetical protein